jgi:hypothetical protein
MCKRICSVVGFDENCGIPCHDRSHINVTLVLQTYTVSVQVLPGSSFDTLPTSSDGVCNSSNIEVEEGVVVKEEAFIALNEEAPVGIKEEEALEDIYFLDIKAEPNEVS